MINTLPNADDLKFADNLLRLRGTSLRKLVRKLIDGNDTAPIIIMGMKPNAETERAFAEANDPSKCTVYNSYHAMMADLNRD